MRRYLQLTITEPLSPVPMEKVNIECAIIGIDLETGKVTLPGGFVCSLDDLSRAVYEAGVAQTLYNKGHGSWRTGRT